MIQAPLSILAGLNEIAAGDAALSTSSTFDGSVVDRRIPQGLQLNPRRVPLG